MAWAAGVPRMLRLAVYTEQFLALALALAVAHTFLVRRRSRLPVQAARLLDGALAGLSLCGGVWLALTYPDLSLAAAINPASARLVALAILVTLLLALVRVAGWPLTAIVLAFGAYGLWGADLPGQLQALPVSPDRLAAQLALDTGGVLGTPLAIAATVVVVFVAFGRLLDHFGGAAFFTDLATATMGGFRGGSAKIAILGSSLFGSISGSAVSNVATTGVVTIPLMRRAGFRRETAGGIEAVASTGGQLTPPVMGAAAFLMAEFLEVPYADVVVAALIPALLYYIAIFMQADLTAARDGIVGLAAEERPRVVPTFRAGWLFLVPFATLIWALFAGNYQPATAGLFATLALVLIAPLMPRARGLLRPRALLAALVQGGASLSGILVITGAAGIVIGVLNETGLSFGLTAYLVGFARDEVLFLLALAALVSIVLGMGMPTVAVYVLLAALVAPALIGLGIHPTSAHMFVLYFGMMSMITPPVAIAAFAAASLSGGGPMRTALAAMKFGWPAFVLPFAFAMNPSLILEGSWQGIAVSLSLAVFGILAVTLALVGHLRGTLPLVLRIATFLLGFAALLWPLMS
ncbi:TRAP transporter permease [Algihabitans sp.]|uniref:TRAP transporter permease n=1 Tax=Algihabitans sp. TaxID=2821514 RepID=UPI003BABBE9F